MTNQEVNDFMQRFLDDDLSEEELEALMEHIRQTPASAIVFERLQQLDGELEQLPKVIPPMSIVDSILPRLELAGLVDSPPVAQPVASDHLSNQAAPIDRTTSLHKRFNFRILGGVVAAGVVLTLMLSNYGPQMSFNTANEDTAATNQILDKPKAAMDNSALEKQMAATEPQSPDGKQEDGGAADRVPALTSSPSATAFPASDSNPPVAEEPEPMFNKVDDASTPWIDQGKASRAIVADDGSTSAPKAASEIKAVPSSETSSDNKAREIAQENSEGATEISIMDQRGSAPVVASPNEQFMGTINAVAEGGQQIIINDLSGNQVYESAVYQGTLSELTWSPDSSQLHFEVSQDNEPTAHMTIHVMAGTESVKVAE